MERGRGRVGERPEEGRRRGEGGRRKEEKWGGGKGRGRSKEEEDEEKGREEGGGEEGVRRRWQKTREGMGRKVWAGGSSRPGEGSGACPVGG